MITYMINHPDKIWIPFAEHVELVLITLLISVAVAVLLMEISIYWNPLENVFHNVFSVIYSIPSLALFAILIPITGLCVKTAVIVLVAYNQYILLRNFMTGIHEVDSSVQEAARGIGMTPNQILWKVQVPLAKKAIFAGIRLAVVSTIGIGTIASAVNAGGLGDLLFDGLRTMNVSKILWGSLLSAGLAILVNGILKVVEGKTNVATNVNISAGK